VALYQRANEYPGLSLNVKTEDGTAFLVVNSEDRHNDILEMVQSLKRLLDDANTIADA